MNDLAHRLKTEREAKGWGQQELADKSHVKQSFIGALEARNQKNSSWLPELANALGVNAYWLKTGKGERSSNQLSGQEQRIIDGFRLMERPLQEFWLQAADTKIAEAAKQTKAA